MDRIMYLYTYEYLATNTQMHIATCMQPNIWGEDTVRFQRIKPVGGAHVCRLLLQGGGGGGGGGAPFSPERVRGGGGPWSPLPPKPGTPMH